jgi:hypothetical protein
MNELNTGIVSDKNQLIGFYASHHAQTENSFCCLVEKGKEAGSYSRAEWFPFVNSDFKKNPEGYATEIIVSAPLWLLERKGIINLITRVCTH